MSIDYRDIRQTDTPKVLQLVSSVFDFDAVVPASRWLRSSCAATEGYGIASIMFGAFDSGELVGIGAAMENPACEHIVSLGYLAVLPDYRSQGIGRALVAKRAAWAQTFRPVPEVDRILELSCYEGLERYHASHGFEVTRRHRPGISCIMQATAPVVIAACDQAPS